MKILASQRFNLFRLAIRNLTTVGAIAEFPVFMFCLRFSLLNEGSYWIFIYTRDYFAFFGVIIMTDCQVKHNLTTFHLQSASFDKKNKFASAEVQFVQSSYTS